MKMCYLIKLHINILTLFKKLLAKEQMSICQMKMDTLPLYLACGNNHDGVTLILCLSYLLLFCFIDHKLYEFLLFLTIM